MKAEHFVHLKPYLDYRGEIHGLLPMPWQTKVLMILGALTSLVAVGLIGSMLGWWAL